MLIYLVEDDAGLSRGIAFSLERDGYDVQQFSTCQAVRSALFLKSPDLILLDWNLPDGDGLKLCQEIHQKISVPVLMITARDLEIDQVMCLEAGADDYISKPFSLAVLKARITALLRRQKQLQKNLSELCSGSIRLNTKEMKAWKNNKKLDLSLTECRLLQFLLENKNQVLLKEQILSHVWDISGAFVEENTLMVNIRRLRTKIEDDPSHPSYIKTIHGMGYLWEERNE